MIKALLGKKRGSKGFTLIELIVVIAILAILAVILVPRFVGFTDKAKINRVAADCKTISKSLATYYADTGKGLTTPIPTELSPNYLPSLPGTFRLEGTTSGAFHLLPDANDLSAAVDAGGKVLIVRDVAAASVLDSTDIAGAIDEGDTLKGGTVVYYSELH